MIRSGLLAVVVALATTACGTVRPYQRGRLMQRAMQTKPPLDAAFDAHVSELREGAIGASGSENASCGCR